MYLIKMLTVLEIKLLERTNILNGSGLDLNSCILLLKEVFNQWMETKVSEICEF